MSAVVEAVQGVVNAVDKYIVEPIKNDPLTFVATVAGAAFLGPGAAAMFGTEAAVGAGIGAAIGNTTAGLAQGESFNEAVKGGAIAGLTTWGGAELANQLSTPSSTIGGAPVEERAFSKAFDSFGDFSSPTPFAEAAKSSVDDLITSGASSSTIPQGALTAPVDLSSGVGQVSNVVTRAPDLGMEYDPAGFTGMDQNPYMAGKGPDISRGGPGLNRTYTSDGSTYGRDMYGMETAAPTEAAAVAADTTGGVYKTALENVDNAALQGGSGRYADILTNKNLDFPKSPYDVGAGSPPSLYQSGQVGANGLKVSTPDLASQYPNVMGGNIGVPSTWDKVAGYGQNAWDWAVKNPSYSIPIGLTAAAYLGRKEPPSGDGGGNQGQIGSPDFYEPLQQYEMRRTQLTPRDLENYGEVGGEQRFFSPTVYEPMKYADGGSVMPQQDKYGYYTYGQIPQTMRGFAKGGLSSLARPSSFDGRSDDIPAVLSDGEFVIDAETVALLGNGSSDAGANRLEEMRRAVRKQKGGALSQGKISSDAKHPLAYLKSSKKSRG